MERAFSSPPGLTGLFLRAGVASVPGLSALPFVGRRSKETPELELVLLDAEIERDRLAAYDHVCGFTLRDEVPSTFIHVLAFPLHLALMTNPSFPFPAVGLVHIENRITQHRPVRFGERLSIRVRATPLEPHRRGRKFSLLSEARVGQELVWEEESVNLRVEKGGEAADAERGAGSEDSDELPVTAYWRLPGDLGRRYAGVSGDHNPIHVHPLTARLFGFPSAIAHGMWTMARSLAALEAELPPTYTAEAAFKRPILLPAKVSFGERAEGEREGEIAFGVRDARKDTPHLVGRVLTA
jgi:acyl dehydratase